MLNLSSNDYLGLAARIDLREEFLRQIPARELCFSSSSSRLLTGSFPEVEALESELTTAFGRPALVFNSGFHMNVGILSALGDTRTLMVSDELIHASMIDGIRLSRAKRQRFPHQDFGALEQRIKQAVDDPTIDRVVVVVESVYSMEGDRTNLRRLTALRNTYPKVMLYVDEAHAVGVYGKTGLGLAEECGCIDDIDLLLGTFGKALASAGGYVVCAPLIREYLINTARSLIFSTALPPMNAAWTLFLFRRMRTAADLRRRLLELTTDIRQKLTAMGHDALGDTHIVPIVYGGDDAAVAAARRMQDRGLYVLPIRPPTVPEHSARVRVSLRADLGKAELSRLLECL